MDSRIREALEWYADEMNYFPRTLIRLAQEKHIQLAPVYSEFGEKAREALALLDAPVASDARELADAICEPGEDYWSGETSDSDGKWIVYPDPEEIAKAIESFAADRERKAREEMARKCADNYCRSVCAWPSTEWKHPDECECAQRAAIMEATHE